MSRRVLVIEDNQDVANLLQLNLKEAGCEADITNSGDDGLARAENQHYDLIILDLGLPGMDGLEVCRRLRNQPNYTPILMLTARSSEIDRVLGLEMGADDYLAKPFSVRELLARVKAILRRVDALAAQGSAGSPLRRGELIIDKEKRKVTLGRRDVQLTAKEFDLLTLFAQHPGRVYTRTQLLDMLWGHGHDSYEHTVNSHINRLRGKIEEDPSQPRYILTVWGIGYKFAERIEI